MQIVAGQLADHPGMDQHLPLLQKGGKSRQTTAQMPTQREVSTKIMLRCGDGGSALVHVY